MAVTFDAAEREVGFPAHSQLAMRRDKPVVLQAVMLSQSQISNVMGASMGLDCS